MSIFSKISGILKTEFKMMTVYRFEMAITLIVGPLSILVFYFLWQAIYANTGVDIIRGFTFHQLVTYYIVSWFVGILSYTHIEDSLRHEVRHGRIIRDLVKPINYIWLHFFTTIGHRLYAVIIEVIPLFIIAFVFFAVKVNLSYLPLFILSVLFAAILTYLISAIVGMSAFWLIHNRGIIKIKRILLYFISGAVLPLTFFPQWFQNLSFYMPFQYLTFVPINIWLAKYTIPQAFQFLGIQIGWILIFYLLCIFVWKSAIKKVTAVGV